MRVVRLLAAVTIAAACSPAVADAAPSGPSGPLGATWPARSAQQFTLYDGSKVTLGPDGMGTDLHTGARVSFRENFNLITAFNGPEDFTAERGIQIDPATRTGWTYSPYGNQIQQFSY